MVRNLILSSGHREIINKITGAVNNLLRLISHCVLEIKSNKRYALHLSEQAIIRKD